jgi:two-component system LytT family response regulator
MRITSPPIVRLSSVLNSPVNYWPLMSLNDAANAPSRSTGAAIRTIIADDERLAREKLRILLSSEANVKLVAECSDGKQAVSAVRRFGADLLLLDIQMPDMDGFQVLGELSPEEMPVVIFTSAYDQYALRAFEAHALDYLLKPFDQERLHHAINRARVELNKSQDREITHRILHLLSQVKSDMLPEPSSEGRLVIKAKGRVVFLNLDEIDWIEASANYVRLNVGKEFHLFRETIGRVSERLNPNHFVRVHRSTIVNVRKIKELIPVNSGEYIVVLKNGKELSCSRGYRAALESMIDKHS